MGQYFHAMTVKKVGINKDNNMVIARPTKWMYSWDYDSGLKLMEHSWLLNPYVNTFAKNLLTGKPKRVVWGGDYADEEPNTKRFSEDGDRDITLYGFCGDYNKIKPEELHSLEVDEFIKKRPYLCNYNTKEYVDLSKLPKDKDGWRIHPLPLLTAEGNERGGGDYHGANKELVGVWARDYIAFRTRIPKGFEEFKPDFVETW